MYTPEYAPKLVLFTQIANIKYKTSLNLSFYFEVKGQHNWTRNGSRQSSHALHFLLICLYEFMFHLKTHASQVLIIL